MVNKLISVLKNKYSCLEWQLYPVFLITIGEATMNFHTQRKTTQHIGNCSHFDVLLFIFILLSGWSSEIWIRHEFVSQNLQAWVGLKWQLLDFHIFFYISCILDTYGHILLQEVSHFPFSKTTGHWVTNKFHLAPRLAHLSN